MLLEDREELVLVHVPQDPGVMHGCISYDEEAKHEG